MSDVLRKLRDPGWTPGRKDVKPLLEALRETNDDDADAIVRALEGVAPAAAVLGALGAGKTRHRFVALLGRIAKRDPSAVPPLAAELASDDPQSRKSAARALGKLQNAQIEDPLLEALARESRPEVKRAIVEALGRVGGEKSRAALAALGGDEEALTKTMRARARLMLERTLDRGAGDVDRIVVPHQATVVLRCREGLEDLLRTELGERAFSPGAGMVRAPLRRGADELQASRLWTSVTIPIAEGTYEGDVAEAIASRIRDAKDVLLPWTGGRFRFRLGFRDAGHRRAVVFRVAELLADEAWLRNDPKESPWEIEVVDAPPKLSLVAVAKKLDDARFAYRVADVPAASHPTIAAALALVSAAEPNDVVWDPFVGSGLELVERARFGSYRALHGADLEEGALAAARKNLESAGVARFSLEKKDARKWVPPEPPTLVLTNPPMGRRVQGTSSLDELLGGFLAHAVQVLAPGGRLVWLTPRAKVTDAVLKSFRMKRVFRQLVDMGGFTAELQRWEKPKAAR